MDLTAYLSPRKTKKPSTLKKPAYEPEAKYIDKQMAISIAKKLRISKIGNVTLRITSKHKSGSDTRVTVKDSRPTTRRIIMDRTKGMMTAENTKNSAVGKCILGPNDYESRRLIRNYDGIDEMKEQKRKYFMLKKRGFAQRQLAKLQEDESQTSNSKFTKYQVENSNESGRRGKRLDPHYMQPLKCDKKEPIDPEIAEITRLIAGKHDPRLQNDMGFDDKKFGDRNRFQYNSTKEQNGHVKTTSTRQPPSRKVAVAEHKPNFINVTTKTITGQNNIPNIQYSLIDNTKTNDVDRSTTGDRPDHNSDTELEDNSPVNQSSSLAVTPKEAKDISKLETNGQVQNQITPDCPKESESQPTHRPASRTTKTIISQLMALKKTTEKRSKSRLISRSAMIRNRGAKEAVSVMDPARDPRFTSLASSLVPDSAKSHDLYRSMGRLSLDNEFLNQLPTIEKSQLVFLNDMHSQLHSQWSNRLHTS